LVLTLIVYVVFYLSAVSTDYIVLSDDLSAPSTANMYKCQNKELISSLMVMNLKFGLIRGMCEWPFKRGIIVLTFLTTIHFI
jgi:hypothetical protein